MKIISYNEAHIEYMNILIDSNSLLGMMKYSFEMFLIKRIILVEMLLT